MEQTFKINENGLISTVQGEIIKLKGYSKFKFFAHKTKDIGWSIRELTTGHCAHSGNSRNLTELKARARDYLKEQTGGKVKALQEEIAKYEILNKEEE